MTNLISATHANGEHCPPCFCADIYSYAQDFIKCMRVTSIIVRGSDPCKPFLQANAFSPPAGQMSGPFGTGEQQPFGPMAMIPPWTPCLDSIHQCKLERSHGTRSAGAMMFQVGRPAKQLVGLSCVPQQSQPRPAPSSACTWGFQPI